MSKRILHVVTNVGNYTDVTHKTGLWLSELTHAWDIFAEAGYEQKIVSPTGGHCPLEPKSLKFPIADKTAKAWLADQEKMALLEHTASPEEIDPEEIDAIYFTGGHGVMFDFTTSDGLHRITREIFERGGVVSAVCHGYCGILTTTLSDGSYLIDGRHLTGFSWLEEVAARVDKDVPYNAEELAITNGAKYEKAKLPFMPHVVADGTLVTGQNPTSAKATARKVVEVLSSI